MVVENCRGCKHFLDVMQNVGTCRRFPIYQNRSPSEVCGEFFGKAVAEVSPTTVGDFLPEMPKKRGRPPKEQA